MAAWMNSGTCRAATVGYISAKQEKYDTAAKDVITKNTLLHTNMLHDLHVSIYAISMICV